MSREQAEAAKAAAEQTNPAIRGELSQNVKGGYVVYFYLGKTLLGCLQEDGSWYDMVRD